MPAAGCESAYCVSLANFIELIRLYGFFDWCVISFASFHSLFFIALFGMDSTHHIFGK